MAAPLVPDALWERVEPLPPLPKPRRFRYPGRKPLTNRQALTGILFVLKTGSRWNDRPRELGGGSGSRCRRRLQAWHRAGLWHRLQALLLAELQGADKIDWSRAAVASSFVRARGGGEKTGPRETSKRSVSSTNPRREVRLFLSAWRDREGARMSALPHGRGYGFGQN